LLPTVVVVVVVVSISSRKDSNANVYPKPAVLQVTSHNDYYRVQL
jgi:hypothetical protein